MANLVLKMAEEIIVDMGKIVVMHQPVTLACIGLGSCIGVALYDHEKSIGGLAHVMLPSSQECRLSGRDSNFTKFADVAIPAMAEEMKKMGCIVEKLTAKIAGGAEMFKGLMDSDLLHIGQRNEISIKEELRKLNIRLVASDTGGNVGRTIRFDTVTGTLTVKTKICTKEI